MNRLVVGGSETYDVPALKQFFARSLAELAFPLTSCGVLLKPNLLAGKQPNKAVNTHPLLVQAVAEIFLEKNCKVHIGDSPGYESTQRALEKSGIMDVVRRLGLEVASFKKRVAKAGSGISPYREFVFGEDPDDYDLIVNMAKLKTHVMMGLTAGVKNTFGFVPSLEKAKWHLRCGKDTALFASILLDIHAIVHPALTVLDGIVAMDGDGPSHGRVRPLGLIAVARDAVALDSFLEKALAIPFPLPISAVAADKGLLSQVTVVDLGMPEVRDFRMPGTMRVDWNLPSILRETARNMFIRKPKCNAGKCTACRTCEQVCPATVIKVGQAGISFNYRKCIRCYCCMEMCPVGAIHL